MSELAGKPAETRKRAPTLPDADRLAARAFDSAMIGLGIMGFDGRWLRVNDAYCRMLGYSSEELLEMNVAEITHPDDIAADLEVLSLGKAGKVESNVLRKRYIARNGSIVTVDLHAELLRDADSKPQCFATRVVYVTGQAEAEAEVERVGMERKLRRSELLHRTLTANIPESTIFMLDQDMLILAAEGEAMRSLSWFDQDLFIGRKVNELYKEVPPEILSICLESYRATLNGERRKFEFESCGRTVEVMSVPIRDDEGAVESALVLARDITETRSGEQLLAERARQQEAVARLRQTALRDLDLQALMDEIVETVAKTLDIETCAVIGPLDDEEATDVLASVGVSRSLDRRGGVPRATDSQIEYLLKTKEPLVVDDHAQETRFISTEWLTRLGATSSVSVIIEGRERPFGALFAHSTQQRNFNTDNVNFLTAVANLLSSAIEQKREEEAGLRIEASRSLMVESALDAIIAVDQNGMMTEFNGAAEKLFGYSRSEVMGKDAGGLIVPERFREQYRDQFLDVANHGSEAILDRRFETPVIRSDGTELEVEFSIVRSSESPLTLTALIRDLTGEHEAERARREAEERFSRGFEDSAVGMAIVSMDGGHLKLNPAICQMVGYTNEELTRLGFQAVSHPDELELELSILGAFQRGDVSFDISERRYIHADGHVVWTLRTASAITDDDGRPKFIYVQNQDITELKKAEDSLEAVLGSLAEGVYATDAQGRITFMNPAGEEMLGYEKDALLGEFSHDAFHYEDEAGRARPESECPILEVHNSGESVRIEDDVFVRADGALLPVAYSAAPLAESATGRHGAVVAFRNNALQKAERLRIKAEADRLVWVERITLALEDDRFTLFAQPIIDLDNGSVVAEELLIRMISPTGETLAPSMFLPTAERYGQIYDIDLWVISRATEIAATGRPVTVNLSADSVGRMDVLHHIEEALESTGADPKDIVFEVTETALMDNIEAGRKFTDRVVELGCRFALDDFGTGHGSFTYLRELPISFLKIDVEFVKNLPANERDQRLVEGIVGIAHGLGQKTIAEGVEDEENLELLRKLGVDFVQGFHLGRPTPVDLAR